jgi:hypothetical protein
LHSASNFKSHAEPLNEAALKLVSAAGEQLAVGRLQLQSLAQQRPLASQLTAPLQVPSLMQAPDGLHCEPGPHCLMASPLPQDSNLAATTHAPGAAQVPVTKSQTVPPPQAVLPF